MLLICALCVSSVLCFVGPSSVARPQAVRDVATVSEQPASIVPGVVVTAPVKEFSHFLRFASVLLFDHSPTGSIGVALDHPTMLTIGEAADGLARRRALSFR